MGRAIPMALRDHLDGDVTTTCRLLRIRPRLPGFAAYGVTNLDRDVTYDHGDGPMTYLAAVGFEPSATQYTASLAVDNAEDTSLLPVYDVPISEADIRAGFYDYAEFDLFLVNYEAPTTGSALLLQSGTIGQVPINDDGLSFVTERRGLAAQAKQSICQVDSLSCRATFGSQFHPTIIAGPLERFPCGVDASALLVDATVTAVGLENTLSFTVDPFTGDAGDLNPGMVYWLTGANAGRQNEIDDNTAGGVITLRIETARPIQVGDTLQYRVDCNKQARDAVKGCKAPIRWGDQWPLHFRGEPDIPIGDMGAMETPGASSGPGMGGFVQIPFPTEAE